MRGLGIASFDGKKITLYTEENGLLSNYITTIFEDSEGTLWLGTEENGLCRFDGKSFTSFTVKDNLLENPIISISEDQKGVFWLTTRKGGACRFDGENFFHLTEKEGLISNDIMHIIETQDQKLWFATTSGLMTYDRQYFTSFTTKEGLNHDFIWALAQDKNENVWVGTEKGINVLATKQKNDSTEQISDLSKREYTLHTLGKLDGLKGLDFMNTAFVRDRKNNLWLGTGKCLTKLDMNNFQFSDHGVTASLKSLAINEQFLDYRNLNEEAHQGLSYHEVAPFENYPTDLKLCHDKNHLTFHFSAIDWMAPHKIYYSYRMKGLDKTWSIPLKETKANYRNLPYGTYIFELRAMGESKVWGPITTYTFEILPPFWHTWWARVSYILFVGCVLLGGIRLRTAQLQKRQRELEVEVVIATSEIRDQKDQIENAHFETKVQKSLLEKQKMLVEEQNSLIEKKNKDITDSIRYGQRIQDALFAEAGEVMSYFQDSFIFFKPKDIVSGDFYWMDQVGNTKIIIVADCTGHGVPGAFMTMMGNAFLHDIVTDESKIEPNQILYALDKKVRHSLRQDEAGTRQDGMDMVVITIDEDKRVLSFSGAKNPLCRVRNGKIERLKGSRAAIGGHHLGKEKVYEKHEMPLVKDDVYYLYTDGYQDQFGEGGKKFMSKKFRVLLENIAHLPMQEQKQQLENTLTTWMGTTTEQTDDILIVGLKV